MSLDKAIKYGKEHRKQYKGGGKLYSSSCRNHGSCPYCQSNRKYKDFREKAKYHKNKKDYIDDIIDNK